MIRSVTRALLAGGGVLFLLMAAAACQSQGGGEAETAAAVEVASESPRDALVARAKSFELDTEYVPPPGDPLEHHTSGFAKILCSAVFITGLDPDFAAENIGYFSSPYDERAKVTERVVDRDNKAIHLTLPSGVTRTAKYIGDQGCVTLPIGEDSVHFTPVDVTSTLPDPSTTPLADGGMSCPTNRCLPSSMRTRWPRPWTPRSSPRKG